MSFDKDKFVEYVRSLARMNIPFRHQGHSIETGIDCVNLPRMGYEAQGLQLPADLLKEFESYSESPDGWLLMAIMRKWFIELPNTGSTLEVCAGLEPGDLLQLYARRNPKHIAIKVGDALIVEAYRSEDRSIEKLIEQPLDSRRRIAAAFRFPDFA